MDASPRLVVGWWCLAGAAFGLLFPVAGWLWAGEGLGIAAIRTAHRQQPVMTIVVLAPLVLAVAGGIVGVLHARLRLAYGNCEQTVRTRTGELELANNRLVETMRARDRFVSTVGHELRTPVSAIVGFAEQLGSTWKDCDDVEAIEMIDVIAGQAAEITDILDDLLVASRAEMGSLSIDAGRIDLGQLAADCTKTLCLTKEMKGRLTAEISTSHVVADPGRVRQIVRNLLTNAERYGGPRISVRTGIDRDAGFVCVADDGAGVPAKDIERIFEPYTHSPGTATVSGSVGIGLSVARTLARLMGGDVAYRRRDDWTEFELRLPLAANPTDIGVPESGEGTRQEKGFASSCPA